MNKNKRYESKIEKNSLSELKDNIKKDFILYIKDILLGMIDLAIEGYLNEPSNYGTSKPWTLYIKNILSNIGIKNKYSCYPYSSSEGKGYKDEWLFDFVWVKTKYNQIPKKNWRSAKGLALACESEWSVNEDDILWDFLKLTFCKADLKLFIYTNSTIKVFSLCEAKIPKNEKNYLFIGFPNPTSNLANAKPLLINYLY